MADAKYEIECPFPDCTEAVYLSWTLSYSLGPKDLTADVPPKPEDHHSGGWEIECTAGHTLLLPGDTGCSCEVPDGDDCRHAWPPASDEVDWSDDYRTFRAHDVARLRHVLALLSGAQVTQ